MWNAEGGSKTFFSKIWSWLHAFCLQPEGGNLAPPTRSNSRDLKRLRKRMQSNHLQGGPCLNTPLSEAFKDRNRGVVTLFRSSSGNRMKAFQWVKRKPASEDGCLFPLFRGDDTQVLRAAKFIFKSALASFHWYLLNLCNWYCTTFPDVTKANGILAVLHFCWLHCSTAAFVEQCSTF